MMVVVDNGNRSSMVAVDIVKMMDVVGVLMIDGNN